MKNIYITTILTLLLVSCGNDKKETVEDILASADASKIQTKKDELTTQQLNLANQIKQLDDALLDLNPDRNMPLVTTITAAHETFVHYLEIQGSVQTKQNLVLTPEMSGILKQVYVKEGQKVSKGQLLARIDDGGLAQQKAQLQIQADLAKTTFERQKRLWEQKIGSEIQYLNTKSNFDALQESVNQINQQLAKTSLKAPFSGIIDDVITEQGSVVAAGQSPILRIVNLDDMYIETDVPEGYIKEVTKGKSVEVLFPVLGKTLEAQIRQTGNFINPDNRTFKVEIAVPNNDKSIKPNLTARLKINDYTSESAILIPQNIISENAEGEQYIYILVDKKEDKATAKQVIIKTGKTQGDKIEILSGVADNSEIIKEGARSVKDGQVVKIISG
jgi:RND family efflux transporter MFP subunit